VSASLSSAVMGGLLDTLGAPDHVVHILRRQDPPLEGQCAVDLARATLPAQDLVQLLQHAQVCRVCMPSACMEHCSPRPLAVVGRGGWAMILTHQICLLD
jgi:hypothetical protein